MALFPAPDGARRGFDASGDLLFAQSGLEPFHGLIDLLRIDFATVVQLIFALHPGAAAARAAQTAFFATVDDYVALAGLLIKQAGRIAATLIADAHRLGHGTL